MEFASEMVIKAALLRLRIAEVPATLSPDLRERAPHLRPWRDGWRHLRYLFMLSPTWVFGVPSLLALGLSGVIFAFGLLSLFGVLPDEIIFGTSWSIVAGFLATCGHLGLVMAVATHFHGARNGYRLIRPVFRRIEPWLTLEVTLVSGLAMALAGALGLALVTWKWGQSGYLPLDNTVPLILSAALGAIGLQNIFGGFLLAIIGGNDNRLAPRD